MVGTNYERTVKKQLLEQGWIVFRSAGSFLCDLVALKPDEHMLVEVKSTKSKKYRTASDKVQFDYLNALAEQGFTVYYCICWKGQRKNKQSWFKLPLSPYPVFAQTINPTKTIK